MGAMTKNFIPDMLKYSVDSIFMAVDAGKVNQVVIITESNWKLPKTAVKN